MRPFPRFIRVLFGLLLLAVFATTGFGQTVPDLKGTRGLGGYASVPPIEVNSPPPLSRQAMQCSWCFQLMPLLLARAFLLRLTQMPPRTAPARTRKTMLRPLRSATVRVN